MAADPTGPRDPLWWSRGLLASGGARVEIGFTGRGDGGGARSGPDGDRDGDRDGERDGERDGRQREGGGRYGADNLGLHVGDDPARVRASRARLAARLGVPAERLFLADQVHGTTVAVAQEPWTVPPSADAVVTRTTGTALAVMVADCVPVVLADPAAGVVGVAHAGRAGMAAGVVPAALAAMADLGAREVTAVVGPSVCPRCYEVPAALRAEVAAAVPVAASVSAAGTPAVDVAAGVLAQLHDAGARVELVRGCTVERPDLFSHRRDGTTGRFAGVVALHPAADPAADPATGSATDPATGPTTEEDHP